MLLVFLPASSAHADVITPPAACAASGRWQSAGLDYTSTQFKSTDVVEVPQKDTVLWNGNQAGYKVGEDGPERPIEGEVQVDTPVGTATIDDWGKDPKVKKTSTTYANEGEHSYDLPSVLIGIKMKLHGEHRENGKVTCAGSVYVQVKGSAVSNPLTAAAAIGLVVSGGALLLAGRPVFNKKWARTDTPEGPN
jgi:hypothetical protein